VVAAGDDPVTPSEPKPQAENLSTEKEIRCDEVERLMAYLEARKSELK
jgi:hypothetical protein